MQVSIRKASKSDYPAIASLVKNELGYDDINLDTLFERLGKMILSKEQSMYCRDKPELIFHISQY